jgi:DNA primase
MIPPAFVQELIARANVVEVVGRHVELKKAGINHKGLCPFHGEKSPSFIVSPTRQTYHCFGCGAHGDAIRFLMEHTGASFVDAVQDLAQQVGMAVPEDERSADERVQAAQRKAQQASLSDMLAQAAAHYRKQLKASPRAIDYLKGRGLSGEIAARFGLGHAPDGWRSLASAFSKYDDPLLVESGLVIVQGDEGEEQKRYDRFRDRVMFPIRSVQGEVIGFGGRVLDKGEPKYLNSPETPVFVKGRELYGLYEARQALREKGHVLVVEGYMDVVALAQLGFPNAVATLGTACTEEHVRKLFRFTDSVVFSFDGDAAGRRAAGRALEAALPHASDLRTVRFLFLPAEHDPDSYVRELGPEAFERCIEQAVPLSRQLVETARDGCDLGSAEGRARFLAQARPLWQTLPDGALRRQIAGEIAALALMAADDLLAIWHGATPAAPRPSAPVRTARRAASGRLAADTVNLLDRALWLMVSRSEMWHDIDGAAHDLLAEQPAPYGAAFAWLERHLSEHGAETAEALLQQLPADELGAQGPALVRRISLLHENDAAIDLRRELAIVLGRLRLQALDEELKLLYESGDLSDDATERARALSHRRADLKRQLSAGAPP